jgi:ATP-dependent RNA helicase DDX10/DBP4
VIPFKMAPDVTGRTRPTKPKKQARAQKRKRDDVDVEKLEQAVAGLVRYAPGLNT